MNMLSSVRAAQATSRADPSEIATLAGQGLGGALAFDSRRFRINPIMAKECFCGCGRAISKFPIGTRTINTRGKQVSELLAFVDGDHPHLKNESGEIAAWCEQGYAFKAELISAMHGEIDRGSLREEPIREWQAEGRNIERYVNEQYAKLGRWVKGSGLTEKEAIEAIRKGEYQPPE
jgi:hypothetical protein